MRNTEHRLLGIALCLMFIIAAYIIVGALDDLWTHIHTELQQIMPAGELTKTVRVTK